MDFSGGSHAKESACSADFLFQTRELSRVEESWVRPLGWEDPLEEEVATYSCILAWIIPWTEEPGGLQSMGFRRVGHE